MTFSFIFATTVISVIVSILLGLLVLKRLNKDQTKITFVLLNFSIALWATANYFSVSVEPAESLKWIRLVLFFAAPQVLFLFLFVRTFPQKKIQLQKRNFAFLVLYTVFVMVLTLTPAVFESIEIKGESISTIPGPGIPLFALLVFGTLFGSILTAIKKLRHSEGIERTQWRFINLGLVTWVLLLGLVFILNAFFGISTFVTLSPLFSLIFLGSTFYTIVRHQLLDVRLVITRSIIYAVLLTVVAFSFIFIAFLSGHVFDSTNISRYVISFLVAAMIVFGLDPLKRFLSRVTDKIFFKAKVDYAKLLQRLSGIVSVELDLQKLIDELERGLIQGLKVKSSLILLRDQDNGQTTKFRATTEHEVQKIEVMLDNASPLVQFVRERRHLSLLESLERRIEDTPEGSAKQKEEQSRAEFERIGAALVAPIFSEDHLVAILTLGPKLSGDSFSNDDIQLIDVLAPQIGSAIQKANLYEEVRQFGESLKVKVEEATAELQERNVSLQTLQTITKDITRTLDFGKVVQNIANAVSTELGFLGAILVFLDDDGKTLRARAVTETSLTKKAIKLLPKPFTEYATDYTQLQSANLGVEVIRTGGIRFTESMAEVISPPIPKPIVFAMQKLMGIKTMILVPIVSEERVIGVIEVGAKRKREEISRREIETLQSMADELGVVARNITLFDRVRKTNDQLEVANKHLQELDRAKSEFVSIASHQLRTPMTGIMGYLSMMTQGDFGAIKPEHQKILVDLLSESQRMIRLINLFLNVSKIEAGKFTYTRKPTQLTDLVAHEVKEIEKAAADKGLKLTVKSPKTSLPLIQADADKLEDVILNLLDNAIKYTAKGTVTATVSQADGMVRFAVKDSGIGIKPTDAPELFNKFVRGSGIAQIHPDGSGLGLFIAKSIIDAHGGRIWAESEGEGQGSTFQFTLPINPPAEETSGHDAAAHVTSAKRL